MFCTIYSTNTLPNFWSNGQNSYEFAYGHTDRIHKIDELIAGPAKNRNGKSLAKLAQEIKNIKHMCSAAAARLLVRDDIKKRCGYLLDQLAAHTIVDRELLWVIQQRKNVDAKVAAITHHDKREARIREKIDLKHEFEPVKVVKVMAPAKK